MILFHHYHHQNGRTLWQKNGGEHRKPSCDSFPEERQKRGTTCTRSTIHFVMNSHGYLVEDEDEDEDGDVDHDDVGST